MAKEGFEWDEDKAQSNLAKHGIGFGVACSVFDDFSALDRFDFVSDPSEVRCVITGLVDGIVLTVV